MADYMSIPASRLIALAHRLMSKNEVNRLVLNLMKTCTNARQAANVLEGIVYMDEKREEKYRNCMSRYREKRMELASSISDSLETLEKRIGTTLTKPFYGPPIPNSKGCIVPMNRVTPKKNSSPYQHYCGDGGLSSPARTRSCKTLPPSSQSHRTNIRTSESIRQSQKELIQQLQLQNVQQQKEELSVKHRATTADPSYSRHRGTESRRARHRAKTANSSKNI